MNYAYFPDENTYFNAGFSAIMSIVQVNLSLIHSRELTTGYLCGILLLSMEVLN